MQISVHFSPTPRLLLILQRQPDQQLRQQRVSRLRSEQLHLVPANLLRHGLLLRLRSRGFGVGIRRPLGRDLGGHEVRLEVNMIQRKPLNVITLGQRESDNNNQMITISNCLLIQSTLLLVIWDSANLGQSDNINWMITFSVITLNCSNCWL